MKHEERLLHHDNVEAIQVLDISYYEGFKEQNPLSWYHEHSIQNIG